MGNRERRRVAVSIGAIAAVITFVLASSLAGSAAAATIRVTTTADGNDPAGCSLRDAIQAANSDATYQGCPAGSGADRIPAPPGMYRLNFGGLNLTSDLSIFSRGRRPAVIDGADNAPFFILYVAPGANARFTSVAIQNGTSNCGGGIRNDGTLTMRDSSLLRNHATMEGGGLCNFGDATLRGVTVAGNSAEGSGGGVADGLGDTALTIENSTIAGNRADKSGGGMSPGDDVLLRNVTVTENTTDFDADNEGDGGGFPMFVGSDVTLQRSIIAGNVDASPPAGTHIPDCQGPTSLGFNLIGDTTGCGYVSAAGDITNADPRLGPLENNGGPTLTAALRQGSPAKNRVPKSQTPKSDQRGAPRLGKGDIGAYELVKCEGVAVNRVGTQRRDKLRGTRNRDGILGLGGNDVLKGKGGKDGLCGGKGRDKLNGGPGRDRMNGGPGKDVEIQ